MRTLNLEVNNMQSEAGHEMRINGFLNKKTEAYVIEVWEYPHPQDKKNDAIGICKMIV